MNESDDARLRALLSDAVDHVDPHDRLGEIRRRTAPSPARSGRRWALVLGAGTATAAVVAAAALVARLGPVGPDGTDTADRPPVTSTAPADTRAAAAYFVGSTPAGARLFREFQPVAWTADPATLALSALRLLEQDAGAQDPDYRTLWPADSFARVTVGDDWISVELAGSASASPRGAVAGEAALGVQQAVHTAEAAVGSSLPVRFETGGRPTTTVLGVDVGEMVARAPGLIAPVNLSDPTEGREATGTITARGTVAPIGDARPTEVSWQLASGAGEVVRSGTAAVDGRSWDTGPIDLDGLPAGTYTLTARVTLPAPGGPDDLTSTDTRTLTVR